MQRLLVTLCSLLWGSISFYAAAEPVPGYLKDRIASAKSSIITLSPDAGKYDKPSEGIIRDLVSGTETREKLQFPDTIEGTINKAEFMNWVRIDLPVKPANNRIVMIVANMSEQNFRCSGSVIHPQLIVTAGHCVHSGKNGRFATQVVVVPGYDKGNAPIGTFRGIKLAAFSGWVDAGDNAHDIGVIQLDRSLPSSVSGFPLYLSGGECKRDLPNAFPNLFDRTTYDAAHEADEVQFQFQNIYRGCMQGLYWHAFPTDQGSSGSPAIYNGTIVGIMSARDIIDGRLGYDARTTQGKICFIFMRLGSGAICY